LSGGVPNMDTGWLSWDGHMENCGAGVFALNVHNAAGTPTVGTIYTFCTDVGVNWRNDTYTAVQFAGQTGVNPQWANAAAIQNAAWLYNQIFETSTATFLGNTEKGVAMQFAIWKALYDTGANGQTSTSFTTGRFQWSSGFGGSTMLSDAQGYLNLLNAARTSGFTTYNDTWLRPNDNNSQGMLYNNLTPVPEPTTLIGGISALGLLIFGARMHTKRSVLRIGN
jgi:hypothetical protein